MLNDTAKNCDRFTLTEINVLREHRLLDDSGELVEVYLERPEEKPLGFGPKMELDAIRKLIAADGTPDQRWLNWIFFFTARLTTSPGSSALEDASISRPWDISKFWQFMQ